MQLLLKDYVPEYMNKRKQELITDSLGKTTFERRKQKPISLHSLTCHFSLLAGCLQRLVPFDVGFFWIFPPHLDLLGLELTMFCKEGGSKWMIKLGL